jgi:hypothetical protein
MADQQQWGNGKRETGKIEVAALSLAAIAAALPTLTPSQCRYV